MNNERRKTMKTLHTELTGQLPALEAAHAEAVKAVGVYNDLLDKFTEKGVAVLGEVRDEENEAYENLSEGQQNGDKGSEMQICLENIEQTSDILGERFIIEMPTELPEEFAEFLDGLSELYA